MSIGCFLLFVLFVAGKSKAPARLHKLVDGRRNAHRRFPRLGEGRVRVHRRFPRLGEGRVRAHRRFPRLGEAVLRILIQAADAVVVIFSHQRSCAEFGVCRFCTSPLRCILWLEPFGGLPLSIPRCPPQKRMPTLLMPRPPARVRLFRGVEMNKAFFITELDAGNIAIH